MTDYKKLCEDLRYCAVGEHDCEKCDYRDKDDGGAECINSILFDAASAIEELQAENERLKKQLDLMAHYIVEFGKVDYFLCDNIPQEIHLKHQPKNDGNYENAPCIECVKEYFATRGENNNITSK